MHLSQEGVRTVAQPVIITNRDASKILVVFLIVVLILVFINKSAGHPYMKKIVTILISLLFIVSVGCEDISDNEVLDPITGGDSHSDKIELVWSYGGVNGSKSVEDPRVQIKSLSIHGTSGLSYRYAVGDLSVWGLSRNQADALACAFYEGSDGKWYGGKFDWVSTSRLTRDFANLNAGYGGWNANAFHSASKRGFLIMTKDGRKRTNLITE